MKKAQDLSQCPGCFCMTKTIKGLCGKCKTEKNKAYVQTQYRDKVNKQSSSDMGKTHGQKKHDCSNTDEYIDSPDGAMCACGKPISKKLRKGIDDLWEKTGPVGVSQWLEQGKKYCYLDYWAKEIISCLPEKTFPERESDEFDAGWAEARAYFLNNLKKKGLSPNKDL